MTNPSMTAGTAGPAEEPLPVPAAEPAGRGRFRRVGALAATTFGVVRKAPMTLGFIAVLVVIALVSGTTRELPDGKLLGRVGTGPGQLSDGKWWTLFSYAFWNVSPTSLVATCLLALAVLVPAERRLGIAR